MPVWVEQLVRHRPLEDSHQALGVAGNLAVGDEAVLQKGSVHATPWVELVPTAHLQPAVDALVEQPPRKNVRTTPLLAGSSGWVVQGGEEQEQ